jgi:hypothetical protein
MLLGGLNCDKNLYNFGCAAFEMMNSLTFMAGGLHEDHAGERAIRNLGIFSKMEKNRGST